MNEWMQNSAYAGVVISLLSYFIGVRLKNKTKSGFLNPLFIAIVLTIGFVLLFNIEYETYNESAKYLSYLLTPATVSLAIPLYLELNQLKRNWKAIIISIFVGTLTSLTVITLFSAFFGFSHTQFVTFLPKSITTAIGMSVSEELNGIVSITVASIIITGIFGAIIAETVIKVFKIKHPISQGVAIGTSAHAIGTSKALELGELQGAMSSLSIVTSGIMTVLLSHIFAGFL